MERKNDRINYPSLGGAENGNGEPAQGVSSIKKSYRYQGDKVFFECFREKTFLFQKKG
jgi:hypothetical protein